MCRSAAEGGRRCSGHSCGAASSRLRQQRSRARRGLEAARAGGDPEQILLAETKFIAVTGDMPPAPQTGTFTGELPVTPEPTAPEKPMPTPKNPEQSTPDPTQTGNTEDRIRAAVRSLGRAGKFVGIKDVRRAVGDDVSHEDITAAMREMQRTDPNVVLSPDSNRRGLTQDDHDAAIQQGREYAHLIAIQHPSIPGEAERVRAAGLANATDEQLEIARLDPDITSALYDEIRGEEKRRKQR